MKQYIDVIEQRQRGGERNYKSGFSFHYPESTLSLIADSITKNANKSLQNGEYFVSEVLTAELASRLSGYLHEDDKIAFNSYAGHTFFPLDCNLKHQSPVLHEVVNFIHDGKVISEGFMSEVVDSYVKTILSEVVDFRPGPVEITFTAPDILLPQVTKENGMLYGCIRVESRQISFQTESSFSIESI